MTKKQLHTNIVTDITELNLSKANNTAVLAIIETYLAVKTTSSNQDIEFDNDTGFISRAFCRYHNRYEEASELVIDNRDDVKLQTSRNRCIAGTHALKVAKAKIKTLKSDAQKALLDMDMENATKYAHEAKNLEESVKDYSYFNYEDDNKNYKASLEEEAPVKPVRGANLKLFSIAMEDMLKNMDASDVKGLMVEEE